MIKIGVSTLTGNGGLQTNIGSGAGDAYPVQDNSSQYTVLYYKLPWNTPSMGLIDVQVEAMAGYASSTVDPDLSHMFYPYYTYSFQGRYSSWSGTQTLVITPLGNIMPSYLAPYATPIIDAMLFTIIAALVTIIMILFRYIGRREK